MNLQGTHTTMYILTKLAASLITQGTKALFFVRNMKYST